MIDYGMGFTNRTVIETPHGKTIIHYGVIPQNDVLQAWADSSVAIYQPTEDDALETEPIEFVLTDSEYAASQSAGDTDIFIVRSPYYTYAPYCSPCAPGAGYLPEADRCDESTGIKTFCFDDSFFDTYAPYIYYRIADDTRVDSVYAQIHADKK